MNIKSNIQQIVQSLPPDCRLIVVSKTQPIERIREAYDAGHRIFGENKVQELVNKQEALPQDIQWHLIGHLQTNKVKYVAPLVHLIHSVDSLKLLREINKQGSKINRIIPCLLQIHIAQEETKFGFSADEIKELLKSPELSGFSFVHIKGFMGMASFTDNTEQIKNEFSQLKALFEYTKTASLPKNMEATELSMGMSSDYPIAVSLGSTLIRVGTAIFGARL